MCQGSKPLRHWSEQWPRVRKIVRSDETDFSCERERARQPMPRVWPWQNQLEQFLSTNAGKPSRERPTLIRIFEVEGYSATGPRNTPTARARLWGWLRCCAPVCEDPVTEPGRCDGPSPCAIVVCPRRGLAVRPEPRRRFGQRRHGHREGGPRPALPQPDDALAALPRTLQRSCAGRMGRACMRASQEPRHRARTDGAPMARSLMPMIGHLPSSRAPARGASTTVRPGRHRFEARPNEDGGGGGLQWQGAALQPPLSSDVQPICGATGRLHPGFGLGEGSGREPGRAGP